MTHLGVSEASRKNCPLVSVVIPTKNSAGTLERCLLSVAEQTYPAVEAVVIDNFSTDSTYDIALELGCHVAQRGPERSAQRNYGIRLAQGDFILILDADMVLSPSTVEASVRVLEQDNDAAVLSLEATGEGFWAKCKWLERRCYDNVALVEAARFFRTNVLRDLGGYDETLYAFEDWDLHNRCSAAGYKIARIPRAQAVLVHDEGKLELLDLLQKRGYYGQQVTLYASRYPKLARRQFGVLSRFMVFARKWKLLLRYPIFAVGLFFMKFLEGVFAKTTTHSHKTFYGSQNVQNKEGSQ